MQIKPIPRLHAAVRHQSSELVFGVVRDAASPMTMRELVRAVREVREHEHRRLRDR